MAKGTTFKGAPKPMGASGHFYEPRRHALQAKGLKTGHLSQPVMTPLLKDDKPIIKKASKYNINPPVPNHGKRYVSRSLRASDVIDNLTWGHDLIEEIKDDETLTDKQKLKLINEVVENLDYVDVDELAQELGTWRDNMEGTNLENTMKYQEVSDACDELESVSSNAQDIQAIEDLDEVDDLMDNIENVYDDLGNVMFPSMY
jgi:hypothetical protein